MQVRLFGTPDAFDRVRLTRRFVRSNYNSMQFGPEASCLHPSGQAAEKAPHDGLLVDANNRVVGPGHASIGLVCSSAGKNSRVGCGNVRVRADYGRSAAIEVPAHSHFLARQLSVKVDKPNLDCWIKGGQ